MAESERLYDKIFVEYPDVVNIADLMKMLSVGKHAAYELVNSRKILCFRVGKNIKIPKISVIEYIVNIREGGCCS